MQQRQIQTGRLPPRLLLSSSTTVTEKKKQTYPGENPGGDDEVRGGEVPVDSLDDNIMGKIKPLDEGKASEEEPVDGRDGVSDGGVGEVVGALAEFLGDKVAVVDDGRDCTDKGEQVECLEEGWMQWHLGYMYVCRGGRGGRRKGEEEKKRRGKRRKKRGRRRTEREREKWKKNEECSLFPPRHRNASKGLAAYTPHKYFLWRLSSLSLRSFFPVQTLSSDAVSWLTLMMPSIYAIIHLLSFFCHLID